MASDDWYRRETWTESEQNEFFRRLARARTTRSKAQYLRIQALHLAKSREERLTRAAVSLLDHMLEQFPDRIQVAPAWQQRGNCLVVLGDVDAGLDDFRKAATAMREFPGSKCPAHLDFAWTVAARGRRDLALEARQLLEEFRDDFGFNFPVTGYRYFGALALFADWEGDDQAARQLATQALDQAAEVQSGLPRHPTLGVVADPDDPLRSRLRKLAG